MFSPTPLTARSEKDYCFLHNINIYNWIFCQMEGWLTWLFLFQPCQALDTLHGFPPTKTVIPKLIKEPPDPVTIHSSLVNNWCILERERNLILEQSVALTALSDHAKRGMRLESPKLNTVMLDSGESRACSSF